MSDRIAGCWQIMGALQAVLLYKKNCTLVVSLLPLFQIGGPVWINPLHNLNFVQQLIRRVTASPELYGTSKRMLGILHMLAEVRVSSLSLGHIL